MLSITDKQALDAIYAGKDVSGYKEAKKIINELFSKLEEQYGKADKKSSVNIAR